MKSVIEFLEREAGHLTICLFLVSLLLVLRHCCPDPFIERLVDMFCGALIGAMRGTKSNQQQNNTIQNENKPNP